MRLDEKRKRYEKNAKNNDTISKKKNGKKRNLI